MYTVVQFFTFLAEGQKESEAARCRRHLLSPSQPRRGLRPEGPKGACFGPEGAKGAKRLKCFEHEVLEQRPFWPERPKRARRRRVKVTTFTPLPRHLFKKVPRQPGAKHQEPYPKRCRGSLVPKAPGERSSPPFPPPLLGPKGLKDAEAAWCRRHQGDQAASKA